MVTRIVLKKSAQICGMIGHVIITPPMLYVKLTLEFAIPMVRLTLPEAGMIEIVRQYIPMLCVKF